METSLTLDSPKSGRDGALPALDVAFLDRQTFGEPALAREVLDLFRTQAASLVPTLPALPEPRQADTAHLLKGSCQGIGALAAAALLQRYGEADAGARRALEPAIEAAFAATEAAVAAYLAAL